jgi:hypothetical protein
MFVAVFSNKFHPFMNKNALKLYARLKEVDVTPAVKVMLREGWASSPSMAHYFIDALLQWLAVLPFAADGKMYVMFGKDLDRAFHAFVLNTKFYSKFCGDHFGFFVDHDPVDQEEWNDRQLRAGLDYTMSILEQTYANGLHPELRRWVERNREGKVPVTAIECMKNCSTRRTAELTERILMAA